LIEGPADSGAIAQLLAGLEGERPPVASSLGVPLLAALLSLSGCYLGNDSGVTHLAAAAGAPVVALFGPTDPAVWGPRGRKVTVLRAGDGPGETMDRIAPEPVLQAVRGALA
jgi:heptosyltransferase III